VVFSAINQPTWYTMLSTDGDPISALYPRKVLSASLTCLGPEWYWHWVDWYADDVTMFQRLGGAYCGASNS